MRTLPTVLKFLPSQKAQDARNFVQARPLTRGFVSDSESLKPVAKPSSVHEICRRPPAWLGCWGLGCMHSLPTSPAQAPTCAELCLRMQAAAAWNPCWCQPPAAALGTASCEPPSTPSPPHRPGSAGALSDASDASVLPEDLTHLTPGCRSAKALLSRAPCVQSLQYWLGGSADNLENLLLNTCRAYVPALQGVDIEVAEPQLFFDTGIWHPLAPCAPPHPAAVPRPVPNLAVRPLLCNTPWRPVDPTALLRLPLKPAWAPDPDTPGRAHGQQVPVFSSPSAQAAGCAALQARAAGMQPPGSHRTSPVRARTLDLGSWARACTQTRLAVSLVLAATGCASATLQAMQGPRNGRARVS